MVHGMPDEAHVKSWNDISRSDDITELAARLGAPVAYERRGNVLYVVSFGQGAGGWVIERNSVDESPTLSSDYNIVGGASLKLATTDETSETLEGYHDLPLFTDGLYGVFLMISTTPGTPQVIAVARVYDGTKLWDYTLRLKPSAATLEYRIDGGSYVTLSSMVNFFTSQGHFHSLGIIFDTDNDEWVQVTMDGVTYDLSGIDANSTNNGTATRMQVSVSAISDGITQALTHLDSVVLAQNPTLVN